MLNPSKLETFRYIYPPRCFGHIWMINDHKNLMSSKLAAAGALILRLLTHVRLAPASGLMDSWVRLTLT